MRKNILLIQLVNSSAFLQSFIELILFDGARCILVKLLKSVAFDLVLLLQLLLNLHPNAEPIIFLLYFLYLLLDILIGHRRLEFRRLFDFTFLLSLCLRWWLFLLRDFRLFDYRFRATSSSCFFLLRLLLAH